MYTPVARKVIISSDVQFLENESWDGTFEKNVKIVSTIKHDAMMEEVVRTTHVSQNFVAPSTPKTLQNVSGQGTLTQVTTQATSTSSPRSFQTPPCSLSSSTSTNPLKERSLREIYKIGTTKLFSLFALVS